MLYFPGPRDTAVNLLLGGSGMRDAEEEEEEETREGKGGEGRKDFTE